MNVNTNVIRFDVRHREVTIVENNNRIEIGVKYPNGKAVVWTLDEIFNELEKVPE